MSSFLLKTGQIIFSLPTLIPLLKLQKLFCVLWIFLHPFVHQRGIVFQLFYLLGFINRLVFILDLLEDFLSNLGLGADAFAVPDFPR